MTLSANERLVNAWLSRDWTSVMLCFRHQQIDIHKMNNLACHKNGKRKRVTHIISALHWLSVPHISRYKVAMKTYKTINEE